LPQHHPAPLISTYDVVLPDTDANNCDRPDLLRHGVLLGFDARCQLRLPAGQERGPTILLADMNALVGFDDVTHHQIMHGAGVSGFSYWKDTDC
jgi:hypothetical protein